MSHLETNNEYHWITSDEVTDGEVLDGSRGGGSTGGICCCWGLGGKMFEGGGGGGNWSGCGGGDGYPMGCKGYNLYCKIIGYCDFSPAQNPSLSSPSIFLQNLSWRILSLNSEHSKGDWNFYIS